MAPGIMIVHGNPNVTDWSLENDVENMKYPIRENESGRDASLDLELLFNEDRDVTDSCNGLEQGFRMILTMPGETMAMSRNYYRLPISENSLLSIKPKLIITSDVLHSYEPNQRQCFYQSERKLGFFKIYTQTNCEAECIANVTKRKCGCVKFSMPSMNLNQIIVDKCISEKTYVV